MATLFRYKNMQFKRFVISNALGNYLEFFDFTLYGFCAPLIAHLFFPVTNPNTSILLIWGIFAASFAIRPIGALFWGYIGDRNGRRFALINSIVLMATTTILFGLLPTYQTIGIAAPIALVGLRMLQGFSVSAEYNGGCIYIYENATRYTGLLCSIASFSCGLGILSGSFIMMILSKGYTADTFPQWHWRLPFVMGGLLIGVTGYYLRRNINHERPNSKDESIGNPLAHLLKNEKLALIKCFCISGYNGVSAYVIYTYLASYLQTRLHLSMYDALKFSTIGICVSIISSLIFGYYSDKIDRRKIMFFAALSMLILLTPMFSLINTGQPFNILFGLTCLSICGGAFGGPLNAAIPALFSKANRYTGASLGYNLGITLAGGSAPFVVSLLLNKFDNPLVVPLYLILFAALAVAALFRFQREPAVAGEVLSR